MKATIKQIGLQTGTDRTVFVTWDFDTSKITAAYPNVSNPVDHYEVVWQYSTGDGLWFDGNETTVTSKQSVWNAQSNATGVRVRVKPISKERTVNKTKTTYFTADWSTWEKYSFSANPPVTPTGLTAVIEKYKLTASLDNLNVNATHIEFQIIKADKSVFNTGTAAIKTKAASYSCTVSPGAEYKVRCRSFKGDDYSKWSEYVDASGGVPPAAPGGIIKIKALSSTSVTIDWENVSGDKKYEVQWTTKKKYFDSSNQVESMRDIDMGHAEVVGLQSGQEYFFRVRAYNDYGDSDWTEIVSIKIGKAPAAPTTWSSKTTVTTEEELTLYWVHNTEDGSTQTEAEVEITANGQTKLWVHVTETGEEEQEDVYSHKIDASDYGKGTKLLWRVRTKGITGEYGEWSIQRTVNIYAPPTLTLNVMDSKGEYVGTIKSFPFFVAMVAGPNPPQKPISFHLSIYSTYTYETVDQTGMTKIINKGDEIYSKHIDVSKNHIEEFTAGDIDLENNERYKVNCVVSMDSGLTAEAKTYILVSWDDDVHTPNAEIGINEDTVSAYIRPYCVDDYGNLPDDILLSVYRREFDGNFVEIATGIRNSKNTFVTDPHPALDYARYRIVAISETTGAVGYYDVPGYPVNEKAVVIQWSEEWSTFDTSNEDALEQPPWSGSMLKLRYNIDISESNDPDVELVEYIGRKCPVTYYGTQRGKKAVWNVEIPKSDKETLYGLRRLQDWMGDVYVREPSGSGYWANVTVSFNQKHRVLSIPVTINVVRVEGGA